MTTGDYVIKWAKEENERREQIMGDWGNGRMVDESDLAKVEPGKVKRQPVDFNFESLNWDFIHRMAQIANYANQKYGSAVQYTNARLEGEKSPINHIIGHVREYSRRQPHDHFGNLEMQLAAIAYGAMMEFFYLQNGGPTVPDEFYREMGK